MPRWIRLFLTGCSPSFCTGPCCLGFATKTLFSSLLCLRLLRSPLVSLACSSLPVEQHNDRLCHLPSYLFAAPLSLLAHLLPSLSRLPCSPPTVGIHDCSRVSASGCPHDLIPQQFEVHRLAGSLSQRSITSNASFRFHCQPSLIPNTTKRRTTKK